jgi:hypothetical protein
MDGTFIREARGAARLEGAALITPVDYDAMPRRPPDFAEIIPAIHENAPVIYLVALNKSGLDWRAEYRKRSGNGLATIRTESALSAFEFGVLEAAQQKRKCRDDDDPDQLRHSSTPMLRPSYNARAETAVPIFRCNDFDEKASNFLVPASV